MIKRIINFVKSKFAGTQKTCCCKQASHLIESTNDQVALDEIIKNLKHVAIIADGHRRWAKQNGLSPFEGHRKGFEEVAPQLCQVLWNYGIHTVSIWCCSTGNLRCRNKEEIDNLFGCFENLINKALLVANNFQGRIIHLGRKDRLPESLLSLINQAEDATRAFSNHVLNICIDYDGADEIFRACQKLMLSHSSSTPLTRELLEQGLDTAGQPFPSPDLVIRPSGVQRLSGFMLWQSIYSELFFVNASFPEFNEGVLREAILDFGKRKRMFSK